MQKQKIPCVFIQLSKRKYTVSKLSCSIRVRSWKKMNTWDDANKARTECFCPSSAFGQVLGGGSNAPCESRHATEACKLKSQGLNDVPSCCIQSSVVTCHAHHMVSHGIMWRHIVSRCTAQLPGPRPFSKLWPLHHLDQ